MKLPSLAKSVFLWLLVPAGLKEYILKPVAVEIAYAQAVTILAGANSDFGGGRNLAFP